MAGTIINNLYPPQVEAVAPAFSSVDSYTHIYYAFSPFNTDLEANFVHITLVYQDTNENALVTTTNTGILIQKISSQHDDKGYYIRLTPSDIIHNWTPNKIYKLQIRFDNFDNPNIPSNTAEYFNTHQENFSEWSTICLLQPIAKPYLRISKLSDNSSQPTVVRNRTLTISGRLEEEGAYSSIEKINYFTIEVRDSGGRKYFTSEKIYTGENINANTLNYVLNLTNLNLTGSQYIIRIIYVTKHLYSDFKDYYITLVDNQESPYFSPTIFTEVDEENGLINLRVKNSISGNDCNLYIKRASSWSDFSDWEEFKIIEQVKNGKFDYTIRDNTIESMVWYKYSIQAEYLNNSGQNFTPIYYSQLCINNFYHLTVSDKDKQISLKFNTEISNLRRNINRNKIDTLGSKYPKFITNGSVDYNSFSISSLISSQVDDNKLFLTEEEVFSLEVKTLYDNYNREKQITESNDYLWERVFRQKLLEWLDNGKPKLLRSETEGNMVVYFSDISLSPYAGTSRRLYNFSATVYEVANSQNLNILNQIGVFSTNTF